MRVVEASVDERVTMLEQRREALVSRKVELEKKLKELRARMDERERQGETK
jgi:hypothetical protein